MLTHCDILVAGGGFAGLAAALNAAGEIAARGLDLRVLLLSHDPFLTIRPRLYEAHGEHLRVPLQALLALAGVGFLEAKLLSVDAPRRRVRLQLADATAELTYRSLVLATGSCLARPALPGAEQALDIDGWEGARRLEVRLRGLRPAGSGEEAPCVAILGGGMSGIELACELRPRLRALGRAAVAAQLRIQLIEQAPMLAPAFGDAARPHIAAALAQAGVEVRLGSTVTRIEADSLRLGDNSWLRCAFSVLATGLRACLPEAGLEGLERDALGRLLTEGTLQVAGLPGLFAAGDAAHAEVEEGRPALMSCQHARSMGKFAGANALRQLLAEPLLTYRQRGYSTCLDLGEQGALHTLGWERQVQASGQEAKRRKRWINRELIYPPAPEQGRAALLAFGAIDPLTGR